MNEQKYGHGSQRGPKPRMTAGEGRLQISALLSNIKLMEKFFGQNVIAIMT
jgi:hypothetical protein